MGFAASGPGAGAWESTASGNNIMEDHEVAASKITFTVFCMALFFFLAAFFCG